MTGVTVGTPTYMSPEQCATTEEVTGASDQYSLGVVAYEMLTGTVPFLDDSIMSIMYAHFNQPPRPVTDLRPDCPPNLAAAVMRMLEKDPASRWPNMDDVVAVCGRPSLRRDDPIRLEMSSLARIGGHVAGPRTPSSPIALSRVRTRPTFRRPRRWLWPTVGAALAVGGALALWRPWGSGTPLLSPPPVAPVAAAHDSVPATAARADSSRAVVRPEPRVAAQRDDSMIGSLRTSALRAAQRAALAGATPADLSPGQTAFASGESLAGARRVAEAMMQFATASAQWADAERQAKARRVAESPPPQPPAPLPAPPPAPAPVPVAAVATDPRPDIEKVIADYATAIESRDIEQVRHAYPGITTAQQGSWQTFFDRVRNLRATLTVANLNLTATTADAAVNGVYEYDNASTGRPERRPVTFRATLARDTGGWRITAIR